ncbi:LysR substrate-binding domain-containing protein [Stappia sp.]|uniref:LysR substrate-binding domain-containing protein n=1 Tax=Stappia sp. TaxID=1870903 RepID=UPI003A9932B2
MTESILKGSLTMDAAILSALPVFRAVALTGGFTAAAGRLGVSASAVSQTIRQLERRIGARLFDRNSRSVRLTERGRQFLAAIDAPLAALDGALDHVRDTGGPVSGTLRITLSRLAAEFCVVPHLGGFVRAYPGIRLELSTDERLTDIVRDDFDAGIRFRGSLEQDMISVPIGPPLRRSLLASPLYLAKAGCPQTPEDLAGHRVIRYRYPGSGRLEPLIFRRGEQTIQIDPPAAMVLDDNAHFALATREGLGIAQRFRIDEEPELADGRLVSLLDDFEPEPQRFHIYFPSRDMQPAKLRAFIDWFRGKPPRPAG